MRGRFLLPAGVSLEVKTGFPVEPVNRYSTNPVPKDNYFPEWTLHAQPQPAGQTEFLAAMQIQRRGEQPEPQAVIESVAAQNAAGIRITCGAARHLVLLRRPGREGPMSAEGFCSDGEAAAVETAANGQRARAFTYAARRLAWREQVLFTSREPAAWSQPQSGGK